MEHVIGAREVNDLRESPRRLYLILSHDIKALLDKEARRREAETGGRWSKARIAEEWIKWAATHKQEHETVS